MEKFTFFDEGGMFVGWFDEFPDYKTQGKTIEELEENLLDIYQGGKETDQCR